MDKITHETLLNVDKPIFTYGQVNHMINEHRGKAINDFIKWIENNKYSRVASGFVKDEAGTHTVFTVEELVTEFIKRNPII